MATGEQPTWIVVADDRACWIFESPGPGGRLCHELQRLSDLAQMPKETARLLNDSFAQGRFGALELMAEPWFLEALRPELRAEVRARVGGWREEPPPEPAHPAIQEALRRLEWMTRIIAACEEELRGSLGAASPALPGRHEWVVLVDGERVRLYWAHGDAEGAPWTPVRELSQGSGPAVMGDAIAALVGSMRGRLPGPVRVMGEGALAAAIDKRLRELGFVE
ncbi:MAG TPA: hypothetical protein VND93_07985 [Myxococcales bacterium]|jgi:hypothetical protein|nr:hypothetical protein [Myxococcales bacterium]